MVNEFDPADVTVLLAVGGYATRALEVTADAIPKHLIGLDDGPSILEVVCRQLQAVGFRRFVFCTGHHHQQITGFVQSEGWISHDQVRYSISGETEPFGLEGSILAGVYKLGITGQAMFIVGDAMIPWNRLVDMNAWHASNRAHATWGVTSFVTERTADIGKVIVAAHDHEVVRVFYDRAEQPAAQDHEQSLTSAGVWAVSLDWYARVCQAYRASKGLRDGQALRPGDSPIIWAANTGGQGIYGYDLQGEVLDLGTPGNIRYAQRNWRQYLVN